jgi:serine/tyrosine/threonine adenylyltransferase
MPAIPQPSEYRPDPAILAIADFLADPVKPADFPQHILRFRNDRWEGAVGLADLSHEQWIAHFGRFEPLPDNLPEPLALRYHGHQFRVYNPDIGDGRGFLFAQFRDNAGRLLDLGTKGSGQTPYSRFGDGRLTLKGGMREVLATEMLEALGVETSKSFSLIETGEALERGDEPSPTRSSVLVRLGHGHIRIGSFQRLAAIGDAAAMKRLVAYSLEQLHGEPGDGADAPVRLLHNVVRRASRLAASYMAAGFVHGVLNTDNIAITAESFDYGPWRFTPQWDPGFTAAYFDHNGLYAFGRQPQAIHWDVVQLAVALRLIVDAEALVPELEAFPDLFARDLDRALITRLGVVPLGDEPDGELGQALIAALGEGDVLIDRLFFDWHGGRLRNPASESRYALPVFDRFRRAIAAYAPVTLSQHDYWTMDEPCSMHIAEVEAIWAQIDKNDDWGAFNEKVAAIRRMGEAMRDVG